MKARKLSEGASFDPQQLKTIGKAFDDAGKRFAPSVSPHPGSVETARLRLANVILSLAKNGAQDAENLTEEAAKIMLASPPKL